MLKVVVFDSGYGGDFFAERLSEELPILEIIRVIDWRHAGEYQRGVYSARRAARMALAPYLGKADLIVFANHFLSISSLKYFRRKYPKQKFLGLDLAFPDTFVPRDVLVLATSAIRRTPRYHLFRFRVKRRRRVRDLSLDAWPNRIDDGELTSDEIKDTLATFLFRENFRPKEVVLACSQFYDLKGDLRSLLGHNLKIYDSFEGAIRCATKMLGIRGGTGKKKK
jgi:glutamate racemase